jgi:hypothetical protein
MQRHDDHDEDGHRGLMEVRMERKGVWGCDLERGRYRSEREGLRRRRLGLGLRATGGGKENG